MATYRKPPAAGHPLTFTLDGEPFELRIRKLNTPESLAWTSTLLGFRRGVSKDTGVDARAYHDLMREFGELVLGVDGLTDEAGCPLVWDNLPAEERHDLLCALDYTQMMDAVGRVAQLGRLTADEKKASSPTSATSTLPSDVDAPSASQAEQSPGSPAGGAVIPNG